jgi:hypothetical protein
LIGLITGLQSWLIVLRAKNMGLREDITTAAAEVLEPNLQFLRSNTSDESRYFVGPEALHAVSWVATSIALPILLSAVNEIIKKRVEAWREKRKTGQPDLKPPEEIQIQIAEILQSGCGITVTGEHVDKAVGAVSEYLSYRGWPTALARSDAVQLIEIIRVRVGMKL